MTADDSPAVPDTEATPDLLSALQASIDRARGRGRSVDEQVPAVPDSEAGLPGDALVNRLREMRKTPRGECHWMTHYDEDDEPYGELCWCTETGGRDHE